MSKVQRNDPCPCGSGKKFKHCHFGEATEEAVVGPRPSKVVPAIMMVLVLAASVGIGWSKKDVVSGLIVFATGLMFVGGFVVLRKPPPPNPSSGDPSSLNFGR